MQAGKRSRGAAKEVQQREKTERKAQELINSDGEQNNMWNNGHKATGTPSETPSKTLDECDAPSDRRNEGALESWNESLRMADTINPEGELDLTEIAEDEIDLIDIAEEDFLPCLYENTSPVQAYRNEVEEEAKIPFPAASIKTQCANSPVASHKTSENGAKLLNGSRIECPVEGHCEHLDCAVKGGHDGQSTPTVRLDDPPLCEEQERLVQLILGGRNVFYTGSAGTGKSTVLKAFVRRLKDLRKWVDILAPTGRAALNVNGKTTWSYAGWKPDTMRVPIDELVIRYMGRRFNRLRRTDVLVIDEISMVENHFFERLNRIMKSARNSPAPFGGVQVVVTGDFCQLPPVKPFANCMECGHDTEQPLRDTIYMCQNTKCRSQAVFQDTEKWAFCSAAWEECMFQHVNLTTIHRQKDRAYIDVLQKCRMGEQLSVQDEELLLHHPCEAKDAVRLFPTREDVHRINIEQFRKLQTRKLTFECDDRFEGNGEERFRPFDRRCKDDNTLEELRDHRYERILELKEGAHVVLLVNINIAEGLINGSQGVVIGFEKHEPTSIPNSRSKEPRGNRGPTVQGDHKEFKEAGIAAFIRRSKHKEWPIVEFMNGIVRTIVPDCTVNEFGDWEPHCLLSRTQIPLSMAWAMTVHKSQGMTLDRVIVNLSKTFEEGQVYVALSRTRSLEGMKVERLGNSHEGGNAQVKEFLREKFGL